MKKYQIFIGYMVDRLKEPSTMRGLLLLATALGAKISPEISSVIVENGLLLAGLVALFTPDSWEKAARESTNMYDYGNTYSSSTESPIDNPDQ